jgi:DNA-binding transcriptional LysR family regulator
MRLANDIEKGLGIELVNRTRRAISLTPAGKVLADVAPELLTAWVEFVEQVRNA